MSLQRMFTTGGVALLAVAHIGAFVFAVHDDAFGLNLGGMDVDSYGSFTAGTSAQTALSEVGLEGNVEDQDLRTKEFFQAPGGKLNIGDCVYIDGQGSARVEADCKESKSSCENRRGVHYRIKYPNGAVYHININKAPFVTKILQTADIKDITTCEQVSVQDVQNGTDEYGLVGQGAGVEQGGTAQQVATTQECDTQTTCCKAKCCVCVEVPDMGPKAPVVWSCSGACSQCHLSFTSSIYATFDVKVLAYRQISFEAIQDQVDRGQFKGHDACVEEHPER